jgi:hypothetical protein
MKRYPLRETHLFDGVKLTAAQLELNPTPRRKCPWSGGMRRNVVTVSNLSSFWSLPLYTHIPKKYPLSREIELSLERLVNL